MSEYEETDSLTLAVAKAIFGEFDNQPGDESPDSRWEEWADRTLWMRVSKAAIKAYELHHEPALTAEEVAKITQAVHDTIGSPAVIAKVEDGNALLQALKNRDLP